MTSKRILSTVLLLASKAHAFQRPLNPQRGMVRLHTSSKGDQSEQGAFQKIPENKFSDWLQSGIKQIGDIPLPEKPIDCEQANRPKNGVIADHFWDSLNQATLGSQAPSEQAEVLRALSEEIEKEGNIDNFHQKLTFPMVNKYRKNIDKEIAPLVIAFTQAIIGQEFPILLGSDNVITTPDTSAFALKGLILALSQDVDKPKLIVPKSAFRRIEALPKTTRVPMISTPDDMTPNSLRQVVSALKKDHQNPVVAIYEYPSVPFAQVPSQEKLDELASIAQAENFKLVIDLYLAGTQEPDVKLPIPSKEYLSSCAFMISPRRTLGTDMARPYGHLIVPDTQLAQKTNEYAKQFFIHPSEVSHKLAMNLMENSATHIPKVQQEISERRGETAEFITKNAQNFELIPSGKASPFHNIRLKDNIAEQLVNLGFGKDTENTELDYYKLLDAVKGYVLFTPIAHFGKHENFDTQGARINFTNVDDLKKWVTIFDKLIDEIIKKTINFNRKQD